MTGPPGTDAWAAIAAVDGQHGAEPRVAGTRHTVADVVEACYARSIEAAQALGLDRDQIMTALTYCADRRCDDAGHRCHSCRLWTQERGIETLDDFCQLFSQVQVAGSPLAISGGGGAAPLQAASLEAFATGWAGEEYWFLARRTLRRLKYKHDQGAKLRGASHVPNDGEPAPSFILVGPQMAENIGMVARAMANFAIEDLRLVSPRDGWPNAKARAAASGAHAIVDSARAFATTTQAIADLQWVCATTARPRQLAKTVLTPEQAAREMRARSAQGQRCGVLFGPERTGLSTDDIANVDAVVMAEVNPTFASINLAQATLLMGYEWLKQAGHGAIGRHTTLEGVATTGLHAGSPPATKAELVGFFEHLETELDRAGHFKSPEKRQIMVRNLRSMFERMGATAQEVRTLRGIVAALTRDR